MHKRIPVALPFPLSLSLLIHIPVDGSSALCFLLVPENQTEIGVVNVYVFSSWAGKHDVHIVVGGCCYE